MTRHQRRLDCCDKAWRLQLVVWFSFGAAVYICARQSRANFEAATPDLREV
jgi:hypothetical protein